MRDLAAQFAQAINDRSQQHASAARNRRASIVREVSQEEHETISTRVVTNYNHMHALTVQYYEVVQAFRVTSQLERAERCLFVPLKLVNFNDPATVERWRVELARAALTPDIAKLLAEFGSIKVTSQLPLPIITAVLTAGTAPSRSVAADAALATADTTSGGSTGSTPSSGSTAAPAATAPAKATLFRPPASRLAQLTAAGWNLGQLDRLGRASGRLLLASRTNAVYLSDEALLIGIELRAGQAARFVVRRQDGSVVAAQETTTDGVTFVAPVPLMEMQSIAVQNASEQAVSTALVLQLNLFGTITTLDVPVHLNRGGATSPLQECARFDGGGAMRDLIDHLEANKLHYSQAIFGALDGAEVAALLARFTFRGLPLAQLVDQQPVAVSANFLVFKTNLPATGEADDPRLADDLTAWRRFLSRAGLDRLVPRSEVIPLPSGGVFAEAVLGRFNAAERIDLQRFWNWQDSPIPISAPEIAAVSAGSRAEAEDLKPGQLSTPVVNIQAPTGLPDPTGVGAAIAALQNANMFRDMSGLAQTAALAQTVQQTSAAGATAAAQQAGQNLFTVMDQNTQRMRIAAQVAAQLSGLPAAGATGSTPSASRSVTEQGGQLKEAADLDAKSADGAPPSGTEADTFLTQLGTKARQLANRVIEAVTTSSDDDVPAEAAATPTRGVGPRETAPTEIPAVLHLTEPFMDPAVFGPTPVRIDAIIFDSLGRHVWERQGVAAPTFTGALRTSDKNLTLNLSYRYELAWPGPTPTIVQNVVSGALSLREGATRLAVAAVPAVQTRKVIIPGAAAPPDDAALRGTLDAAGVNLLQVLAKPTLAPRSDGGFDATFPFLKRVAIEQLADIPT